MVGLKVEPVVEFDKTGRKIIYDITGSLAIKFNNNLVINNSIPENQIATYLSVTPAVWTPSSNRPQY